jgi:trimeric autotransporter adhesin
MKPTLTLASFVAVYVSLSLRPNHAFGASTFSDDNWTSMSPGIPGVNGWVSAVALDSSSNLYVGGHFSVAGDVSATNIAKWDGSRWSSVGPGLNDNVNALLVSGADLYVGGYFTNAGESGANYIAKWNGSNWTSLGSGMNGEVLALAASGNSI